MAELILDASGELPFDVGIEADVSLKRECPAIIQCDASLSA